MHELLMEVDFRVHVLSSDIERTHNPDYGPGFDLRLDTDCRTELLIIEEADPLKPKAGNSSAATSTATTSASS